MYSAGPISGFTVYRSYMNKDGCGLIHCHEFMNTGFYLRLLVTRLFSSFYSRRMNTPDKRALLTDAVLWHLHN